MDGRLYIFIGNSFHISRYEIHPFLLEIRQESWLGRIIRRYIVYLDLDSHDDICIYSMCGMGELGHCILFPLCGQYVYELIV